MNQADLASAQQTIDAHDHAREGLALELGWKMFPYTMPTADGKWCNLWCPPGEMVHISTSRELPTYAELVAALTVERDALRQRVEKAESLLREVQACLEGEQRSHSFDRGIDQFLSERDAIK